MEQRAVPSFTISSRDFTPAYLNLGVKELRRRAEEALALLSSCTVCPRNCRVNRLEGRWAVCKTGRYAVVSSFFPHFGEEDCLRGWNGSGTIFFSWCNLKCVFCQNWSISHLGEGRAVFPEQLARMMVYLQDQGCHNINLVTPEHVVPQVLEALPIAVEMGLRLPIVYNTSAYDSLDSLRLLDGIVDIYMPDFKFWDREMARKYLKAPDYPDVAKRVIKEMHRQVGPLVMDEHGLAKRGVLVRHLVMPGGIAGTREIMRFLAQEVSPHTYVNIMDQYYPAGKVSEKEYSEINRRITRSEYEEALAAAREAGLYRFDTRWFVGPRLLWLPD
jgi:putative pyruvate formate lyase activating enzyme